MKTVVGAGGAEGATVAVDLGSWSGVLVRCEVVFECSSEEVFVSGVYVTVEGGVHTMSGPMWRPVMVMLAQGVGWAVEKSVVLDSSVTIVVVTVVIGVRQAISSESLPLFPKVGEAPTVCCVPYLVESVVLDIVLLG
jgi:hypothetical protein